MANNVVVVVDDVDVTVVEVDELEVTVDDVVEIVVVVDVMEVVVELVLVVDVVSMSFPSLSPPLPQPVKKIISMPHKTTFNALLMIIASL